MFKKEIRVIGIDDSPFDKFKKPRKKVLIVGVITRGGTSIDGILSTKVAIDGNDATKNIILMINKCKFKPQLQCIFLNGIAVAGFNVIDIKKLNEKTGLPVIVIIRKHPEINKIKNTLRNLKMDSKIKLIDSAGEVIRIKDIYVQLAGINLESAKEILNITCTRSNIPEPLRLAHLVATGIAEGESRGRA